MAVCLITVELARSYSIVVSLGKSEKLPSLSFSILDGENIRHVRIYESQKKQYESQKTYESGLVL